MALLDGSLLAISLFIVCLLVWLAVTVFLTAERRDKYVWLICLAMLVGAAFFGVHAVLMSNGHNAGTALALAQWPLVWVVGVLLPCAWYMAVLWHTGFWEDRRAMRHRAQHTIAYYALVVFLFTCAILVFSDPTIRAHPWALFSPFNPAYILAGPYFHRVPVLALIFITVMVLCIALALDVLYHPAPSARLMGDTARMRARPYLVGITLVLFAVSLLVCGTLLHFMPEILYIQSRTLAPATALLMSWIDLAIITLIAATVFLMGQAIVSYEIFTGNALLRRGLRRRWYSAVTLAAGFSGLLAALVVFELPIVYGALIICAVVGALYAVNTWRSFAEHEAAIANIRLFNSGSSVFTATSDAPGDTDSLFRQLCEKLLGVRSAMLFPQASYALLLRPLAYPAEQALPTSLADIATQFTDPKTLCLPLDASALAGAQWAVPLWNDRGLSGILLLGAKRDGGLYTQEEMEVARAIGEQLLERLAGNELTRRLMLLQRTRMMQEQVVDQRTRRALHDEVLPAVQTMMIALSAGQLETPALLAQLTELHQQIANILHAMPSISNNQLQSKGIIGALKSFIETDLDGAFASVTWELAADYEERLATLTPLTAEVLFGAAREAVRNAARHASGGNNARPINLRIGISADTPIRITIEDDGVGYTAPTATPTSTGHGVIMHSTLLAVIGGSWEVTSVPGKFTRVTLVGKLGPQSS